MKNLHEILQQYWGFNSFRTPQQEIIEHFLSGQDTLALLPTGGGKSICFQVPALALDGLCIVISPLIALMKDQVDNLQKRGIAAASINSSMHYKQIDIVLNNAMQNQYKLLYISPERIHTDIFLARVKNMNVSMIAVDEAHCISQWGYDFRPSYQKIISLRELLPQVPCMALTATATEEVVLDIQEKLKLNSKQVFKKSFARSNLAYVVMEEENKWGKLLDIVQKVNGTGIIYVRNRKRTKEIAEYLWKQSISADFYHAGLSSDEREQKQSNWIHGKTRVIVCTNAFGMGIDKPDVRFVIHLDIPPDIESYYQEAGRAGRDGQKSYAVCLYNSLDIENIKQSILENECSIDEIRECYDYLGQFFHLAIGSGQFETFDFSIEDFCKKYALKAPKVLSILKILEQQEILLANDAVYNPAKLMFTCSNEELYKLQISHKQYEPLIKLLLRSYGGLFDNYAFIKESFLANKLKTSVENIKKALVLLQSHQYLDYIPEKNSPTIEFLQARHSKSNLLLDTSFIIGRQKLKFKKCNEMIHYMQSEHLCRTKILCAYFGDKDTPDCQVCDVCLKKKKLGLQDDKYAQICERIIEQLTYKEQNIASLVKSIPAEKEADIVQCIQWLLETKVLTQNDTGKLVWQKTSN